MLMFDPEGWAVNGRINVDRYPELKEGAMGTIHGIIVHQTASPTTASTLAQYKLKGSNGAHFLIEKSGNIIQTASVLWKVRHVGKIKARCVEEHRCSPVEAASLLHMNVRQEALHELAKPVPARYPANKDAIGIELVGDTTTKQSDGYLGFEAATKEQNQSLKWLVAELRQTFKVALTEVLRHPQVSRKDPHEAESAQW